jgi:hypothetical protein
MLLLSLSLPPPFVSLPVQGVTSTPAIEPRCVLERLRPDTAFSSSSQILISTNPCARYNLLMTMMKFLKQWRDWPREPILYRR